MYRLLNAYVQSKTFLRLENAKIKIPYYCPLAEIS